VPIVQTTSKFGILQFIAKQSFAFADATMRIGERKLEDVFARSIAAVVASMPIVTLSWPQSGPAQLGRQTS